MPYTTPTAVAANGLIQSVWGNQVVDAIEEGQDEDRFFTIAFGPLANTDTATDGSYANWIGTNSVTVPTWATTAWVTVHISNVTMATSSGVFTICASFATITSDSGTLCAVNMASGGRESTSFVQKFTGIGTGAGRSLTLKAQRESGTGVLRADSQTKLTAFVAFSG